MFIVKKLLVVILCFSILFSCSGCFGVTNSTSNQTNETFYNQETENHEEEIVEQKHEPLNVGTTITSGDWKIKLTDAYTSLKLESSESRTAWDANDGYAFLILEFDVTCLNSTKPTVDGDAITDVVATVNDNTYGSWKYQYIDSEIWSYIRNNYLEANLPLHIYVYTMIPSTSMNNTVRVNLKLAGQPKTITIH